ncbi:MAG: yciF [Candidatus Taylorbacteria bacterium]|nr:yciF [Candidatus Taylorbacteria bacterium]
MKKPAPAKQPKKELATMQDLFLIQMKDVYDTEKQIAQALPTVIRKAAAQELKDILSHHLEETDGQIERLERIYELMDMSPKRKPALGIKGLIDDAKEIFAMKSEPDLLDAAIITSSSHIEHHEIAGYRAIIACARLLGMPPEAIELFRKNLEQEENMDEKLSELASGSISVDAGEPASVEDGGIVAM